jgi:outer membrane protein TolC
MLMVGIQNFPVTKPGFADFMTMKMVGIGQTVPYPGKLALRTKTAERELVASQVELEGHQLEVVKAVKTAYYDLVYFDRALEIIERNRRLLIDFMKVTETRYTVGTGSQEDVLRVRVEAARLGEEAVALIEQRRATLALLNAVLDRPSDTPIREPAVPQRIARAAIADSIAHVRFASATLGARVADSPIPPLETLQTTAVRQNPMIRAHGAMISAQMARVELARKDHLPDVGVSFSYGQRDGFSDMVSAQVSIPIPLQKGRKQDQVVAEALSEVTTLEAEHSEQANDLRANVARLHSELERDRAQLALYVKAILPQGRSALSSATAGYQVGRASFLSVLDTQATLFNYETSYFRVLSDFAKKLAELERIVGEEIIQ